MVHALTAQFTTRLGALTEAFALAEGIPAEHRPHRAAYDALVTARSTRTGEHLAAYVGPGPRHATPPAPHTVRITLETRGGANQTPRIPTPAGSGVDRRRCAYSAP
ncbi:hypothetical protein [Frankia sp. AgB32]|uniref:hypothetical protein n=1 Tax=Frankia sp. AgB32 TaxID=631119 RepID=UPI00200FD97B|nr:hypothetical protein [Frankia sp. AgB32]MCK9896264.1 hypothetical protein [Frankia sp. AgB32]